MNALAPLPTRPGGLPLLMQSEAAECGLACLAMIASAYGHEVDLNALRHRFQISLKGTTLKDIVRIAEAIGLSARPLRIEPGALDRLQCPAILHMDMNHFVVLKEWRGGYGLIHDPALGVRRVGADYIDRHFTGIALELVPGEDFAPKAPSKRLRFRTLAGSVPLPRGILPQALALSIVFQLLLLAAPFYVQLVVDHGLSRGDLSVLTALAIGFGLLALLRIAVAWVRSRTLLALGGIFDARLMRNIVRHLLQLPNSWFEARHVASVLSRIASTQPIRDLVSEGLISAIVDGLMSVLTIAIAALFAPRLALIVLAGFLLNCVVKYWQVRRSMERELEWVEATAKAQQEFMETLRSIATVKLFCKEAERERRWTDRHVESVNARYAVELVKAQSSLGRDLVQALVMVAVVYVGAVQALAGTSTLGVVMAFLAYQQMFADSSAKLLDFGGRFRLLDVHLQRLADMVEAAPEEKDEASLTESGKLAGRLSVHRLSFRYGIFEEPVLRDVSFRVEPGEFVAITGPSGGGKTTLLKLLVGLLEPVSGEICYDDVPLRRLGLSNVRDQIGVVSQDDILLSGSVAQNITFFDSQPDMGWMKECARMAAIHDDIASWPMAYNTLIGDMGTVLSGGQRQRVLLARALYRRPRILLVDEGTSQLDVAREREVNANIRSLDITRLIIAHRRDTIEAADRILELRANGLREMPRAVRSS